MLIKCPNCKKMFDDKLSACPSCGFERHIVPLILNEKKEKEEAARLKEENRKKLQALVDADLKNKKKLEDLAKIEAESKKKTEEIKKTNQEEIEINIGISSLPDSVKPEEGVFETEQITNLESLEYSSNDNPKVSNEIFDKEKLEQEIIEAEKAEKARLLAEKKEEERLRKEKISEELDRLEKVKNEKKEIEKVEREKAEAERQEKKRLEAEKLERLEERWRENERIEAEKKEVERLEKEKLEAEKKEAERLENIRLEAEKLEQKKLLAQKLEEKRLEEERLNQKKLEEMRLEKERVEAERLEAERLEKEIQEIKRKEAERLEAERLAAEKLETERLKKDKLEREKLEAEKLEAERLENEKSEAERLENERIEAERLEKERKEEAKLEAKRQEARVVELLQRKNNSEEEPTPAIKTTDKKAEFIRNKQSERLQKAGVNKKTQKVKEEKNGGTWNYISKESINRNKKMRKKVMSIVLVIFLFAGAAFALTYFMPEKTEEIWQSSIVFVKKEIDLVSRKISSILHPGKVNVNLVTVPAGASVFLDGVDTQKKTPVKLTDISEGKHDIAFKLKNYDDFSTEFSVLYNKGVETSLTYQLSKTAGLAKLVIKSNPPGAAIFIDDATTGKMTPSTINIKAGEHTIVLKLQQYNDFSVTKQIIGDKTFTFSPVLVPSEPKGVARFVSNPVGAEIWIDGNNTGKKTPSIIELKPGDYKAVVRKEGYQDWIVDKITVVNGYNETFYAYLIKKY